MDKQYNLYNFEADFKKYLLAGNTKTISIKNYLSDLRHFFGWAALNVQSTQSTNQSSSYIVFIKSILSEESINQYVSYLNTNTIPIKTINRRLSTLRKFGHFCISQGWITQNPALHIANSKDPQNLSNINAAIDQFAREMKTNRLDNTIITNSSETIRELFQI